jgi:hypothetical protein
MSYPTDLYSPGTADETRERSRLAIKDCRKRLAIMVADDMVLMQDYDRAVTERPEDTAALADIVRGRETGIRCMRAELQRVREHQSVLRAVDHVVGTPDPVCAATPAGETEGVPT